MLNANIRNSTNNSQLSFGSGKTSSIIEKTVSTAKKQSEHLFVQGTALTVSEAIIPSQNLGEFVFKKIIFDVTEFALITVKKMLKVQEHPFKVQYYGTNSLAYLSDGINRISKLLFR
jgi:hypothetical protein